MKTNIYKYKRLKFYYFLCFSRTVNPSITTQRVDKGQTSDLWTVTEERGEIKDLLSCDGKLN